MSKDQALRLALEALENLQSLRQYHKAIAAIKQALANDALDRMADNERELGIQMQPEPEILGWATHHDEPMLFPTRKEAVLYCEDDEEPRPLYTSPPKREPLTDEEIDAKWRKATELPALTSEFVRSFARAIEAAHGIKENT